MVVSLYTLAWLLLVIVDSLFITCLRKMWLHSRASYLIAVLPYQELLTIIFINFNFINSLYIYKIHAPDWNPMLYILDQQNLWRATLHYLQSMAGMFQRYHTASLEPLISYSRAHVEFGVGCCVNWVVKGHDHKKKCHVSFSPSFFGLHWFLLRILISIGTWRP